MSKVLKNKKFKLKVGDFVKVFDEYGIIMSRSTVPCARYRIHYASGWQGMIGVRYVKKA